MKTGKGVRWGALALVAALSSGCGLFGDEGYFRDRDNDYLKAEDLVPLRLPEGVDGEVIDALYYVPPNDALTQPPTDFDIPRPEPLVAGDFENQVRIQTLGQRQWILVRLLPAQVWPRVKEYLIARQMGLGYRDGAAGLLQSGWVSDNQAEFEEIFRFRLSQGLQQKTTEVEITQQQLRNRAGDAQAAARADALYRGEDWPAGSDVVQRERLLLQQFASWLAERVDVHSPLSMVAQDIDTSRRLYSVTGAAPRVMANLDMDRAWASLAQALDKAGFQVLHDDRSVGQFAVIAPEQIVGDGKERSSPLRWLKLSTYQSAPGVRCQVTIAPAEREGWVQIRIADPEGAKTSIEAQDRQQLLSLIGGYLT